MSISNRLVKNSVWNVGSLVLNLGLGLITVPIILSLLGTSQYGIFTLLTAVLFPLGLTTLNLGQATIKYVAEAHGRSDLLEAGVYFRTTFLFNLIIGLIGSAVLLLLSSWLTTSVFNISLEDQESARQALHWLALGWTVTQIYATFSGIPAAFQRYDLSAVGTGAYSILSSALPIGVLYFTHSLVHYVQARVTAQALSIGIFVFVTRRLMPGVKLTPRWDSTAFRRSVHFGMWQTFGQVGGLVAIQSDLYLLGILLNTTAVGLFNIAATFQQQAYSLGMKFGEVLFPAFSYQSAANDRARESTMLMRSTWLLTTVSAGIMVPVIVVGGDFLRLWVGPTVASGSESVLRVLAIAGLIGSASNAGLYYLLGVGKTKWIAIISLATGMTVLIVSFILIPSLGLSGAGWGSVASMLVQAGCVTVMWRRLFRTLLPMPIYLSALYGPVVVALIMCGLLSLIRASIALPVTWLWFIIEALACSSLTVFAIINIDRILPGGAIRHLDIQRIAVGMKRQLSFSWLR